MCYTAPNTDTNYRKYFYFMVISWLLAILGCVVVLGWPRVVASDTCVLNSTFNRWECCHHVMENDNGDTICVPTQSVRVLNNQ